MRRVWNIGTWGQRLRHAEPYLRKLSEKHRVGKNFLRRRRRNNWKSLIDWLSVDCWKPIKMNGSTRKKIFKLYIQRCWENQNAFFLPSNQLFFNEIYPTAEFPDFQVELWVWKPLNEATDGTLNLHFYLCLIIYIYIFYWNFYFYLNFILYIFYLILYFFKLNSKFL